MKATLTALPNGAVTLIVEAENDLERALLCVYRSQTGDGVPITSLWYRDGKVQTVSRILYEGQRLKGEEPT